STALILLRIPIVRKFELGCSFGGRSPFVVGGRKEYEGKPSLFVLGAANFLKAEFVAIEVKRLIDIADTDHCVEITHLHSSAFIASNLKLSRLPWRARRARNPGELRNT